MKLKFKSNRPSNWVCCGNGKCCPTVSFDSNDNAVIVDDFGGTVKMSADQFLSFVELIKESVTIE